jgi:MSHA biogenesis protein MshI
MRWPWKRQRAAEPIMVSWSGDALAYVRASLRPDGLHEVLKFGVERQGDDSAADFVRRLQGLGLKGMDVHVMLRPEQYQLLQIDTPAVAPEEMRAAARWQIREMVAVHMDDITLDVMRVGGVKAATPGQLFVVVAGNTVVNEVMRLGQALKWDVPVVDIQETAQRNLQTALARRDGRVERANAALMMVNERQALLTISANEELFYTRRIDLGAGFMEKSWKRASSVPAAGPEDPFAEVPEYVPAYAGPAAGGDDEPTQRFVVELQRSLDVWDRTWSNLPLDGLWVDAGERTVEMATWLSQELGFGVKTMDVDSLFPGFDGGEAQDRALCRPLLGVLLRTVERNL